MPAKGKLEVIGCSAAGRVPLRLLRRHRTAENRSIEAARRGDVVVLEAGPGGAAQDTAPDGLDRIEITGETTVRRIAPAEPAQLPGGPDAAGEPPA
jgi:hypothetical protein